MELCRKERGRIICYVIPTLRQEESDVLRMLIVTNQYNEIAQMELRLNEHVFEEEFNVNQKNVSWINIPKTNGDGYSFDYKYFDVHGNLINVK